MYGIRDFCFLGFHIPYFLFFFILALIGEISLPNSYIFEFTTTFYIDWKKKILKNINEKIIMKVQTFIFEKSTEFGAFTIIIS